MKRILIALVALLISQAATPAQSQSSQLTAKQLAKAEKLIAKLEQFAVSNQSRPTSQPKRIHVQELSSGLYKAAGEFPEGDFKTDITTAIHFYEIAALNPASGARTTHCEQCASERAGIYQRLCESNVDSEEPLILAKARLHLNWAKASAGILSEVETKELLSEIEVERRNDQALAGRAVVALNVLKREVLIHSSLGDFEETGTFARVPYETFRDDLRKTSAEVDLMLSWLPENRLKFEIRNALYSFQDGGRGWDRIYQPRVVSVSELSALEAPTAPSVTAFQATVPYTVAINWRQAGKYLDRAEALISR